MREQQQARVAAAERAAAAAAQKELHRAKNRVQTDFYSPPTCWARVLGRMSRGNQQHPSIVEAAHAHTAPREDPPPLPPTARRKERTGSAGPAPAPAAELLTCRALGQEDTRAAQSRACFHLLFTKSN